MIFFAGKTDFTLLKHVFSNFFNFLILIFPPQLMFLKIARFQHQKITISQNAKYLFISMICYNIFALG
jgi:hypothetical protein